MLPSNDPTFFIILLSLNAPDSEKCALHLYPFILELPPIPSLSVLEYTNQNLTLFSQSSDGCFKKPLDQYWTCLYLFECTFHNSSKYGNDNFEF